MPPRVELIAPGDLSLVGDKRFEFNWKSAGANVGHYQFQLAADSLMTDLVITSTIADTLLPITAGLANQGLYWWRVRAGNNIGVGLYSKQNRLIYTGPTSVESPHITPLDFYLAQNYPNPFNPETTIRYGLAEAGKVTLRIFDIRGRHVRTLLDSFQSAGTKTIVWDGKDASGKTVASGTYFSQLWTESGFVKSRSMLLTK
jgi:hypothetical protein